MTGSSGTLLDPRAEQFFSVIKPLNRALDLGAGRGKYLDILRRVAPGCYVTAVEIFERSVQEFRLCERYNRVVVADVLDYINSEPDETWDLVVAGDILEHLDRSRGLDLLHQLVYRSRYLWLQWPVRYVQGTLDGNSHERHRSIWSEQDVQALRTTYRMFVQPPLEAFAVAGYLSDHLPAF